MIFILSDRRWESVVTGMTAQRFRRMVLVVSSFATGEVSSEIEFSLKTPLNQRRIYSLNPIIAPVPSIQFREVNIKFYSLLSHVNFVGSTTRTKDVK
jgi:hypothetical protein